MTGKRWPRLAGKGERAVSLLIAALLLLFFIPMAVTAYWETTSIGTNNLAGESIEFLPDNIFLNCILLVLFLAALYLFYRHGDHIRPRRMEALLMLWVFGLGAAFLISTKLQAPFYSDSYMVTYAAQRAALGDFAQLKDAYFRRFPFQLGYVLYSELAFRVLALFLHGKPEGYRWIALQGGNLLWLMLAYHALIECARLLFQRPRVIRLTILLLFFALPPVLSVSFLYGNIPALACGVTGLWMYLLFSDTGKLRYAVFTALAMTFAVLFKLNLLIFCLALGIVWFIEWAKRPKIKSLICLLLAAACVLGCKGLPQKIYERRSGLEFGKGIPMIAWMAMGFDTGHAAAGWYREEHTVMTFEATGEDPEATAGEARAYLGRRIRQFAEDPAEMMDFFWQKLRSQWNEPSCQSLWVNQVQPGFSEKGKLYDFFCGEGAKRTLALMNQFQQLLLLGCLFAALRLLIRKKIRIALLPLVVLGGISYHLLFEAKSQYALPYFVLMIPMAAYGLSGLFHRIEYR